MKNRLLILWTILAILPVRLIAQDDRLAHNIGLSVEAGFSNLFFGSKLGKRIMPFHLSEEAEAQRFSMN